MKIPYSRSELLITLRGLDTSKFDENKMRELRGEYFNLIPEEKNDFNKRAAEFHGINIEQLIASPNYKVLCQECFNSLLQQAAEMIMKKIDVTEKEAWALVALGLGLLD